MTIPSNTLINRYGALAAEIYDIDKAVGSLHDPAFYLNRFASISGPILEPACGSGRALIPMLEAGHDVTGFDASNEMLENCRGRCAARGLSPDLSQQRFEDFQYQRRFEAIFLPAGSFGLIDNFAVSLAVLKRFVDHLAPGGLLMLDVQPISALAQDGQSRRSWAAENGDLLICETRRMKTDWMAQSEEHHTIYERWRGGKMVDSDLEPMALRYWGVEEMRMALRTAGFGEIAVFGNFSRSRAPRSTDSTLTFEAIKES